MKIVLEFLTIWWIRSSEGSEANLSEVTWVKLPARRGCHFSGITKPALLASDNGPSNYWVLSSRCCRCISSGNIQKLWGFKQKSWTSCVLLPLLLSRQEDVVCTHQCNGYRPGAEDIPTQLLEIGGKNYFPDAILTLLDFQQLSNKSPWRDVWLPTLLPGFLDI